MFLFVNTTRRRTWGSRAALLLFAALALLAVGRAIGGIVEPLPHRSTPLPLAAPPWHGLVGADRNATRWLISSSTEWTTEERDSASADHCSLLSVVRRYYPFWAPVESCEALEERTQTPLFEGHALILEKSNNHILYMDARGVHLDETVK